MVCCDENMVLLCVCLLMLCWGCLLYVFGVDLVMLVVWLVI